MMNRIALPLVYLAFAGLAACGGKVVFVDEQQDGGGGASTTSTTGTTSPGVTTSTGTGGFSCDVPIPAGDQQVYDCIAKSGTTACETSDSLDVFQAMSAKVNSSVCSNGCCMVTNLVSVPCGPDPSQTIVCCYFAFATVSQECTGGGTGD